MAQSKTRIPISRRELLRATATLGGLAALAAVMEACAPSGTATPIATATPALKITATDIPTSTPQLSLTPSPFPAATSAPSPTPEPAPTATARRSPTASPNPTAAASPSPTASPEPTAAGNDGTARVAFVKTSDRVKGVRRALALLGVNPAHANSVLLKPNFNSSDPAPGSTHNDVLRTLVEQLWEMGARSITVADRSGMGDTRRVLEQKGVYAMADELGFDTLVLEDLEEKEWVMMEPRDTYWQKGFPVARSCLESDAVVQACCLKTHRFGGHFTLSLKNSVGLVAKFGPGDGYNYMGELHASPHQRLMIADINAVYTPSLVVMDGVEAFVNGGPDSGKLVQPDVVLASTDRVAIDAVGVALLRHFGTTTDVSHGPIFELEQIARAVELGLGVERPEDIRLVTDDAPSEDYANLIRVILLQA